MVTLLQAGLLKFVRKQGQISLCIEQICKEKDTILANKLADSVISNKANDFWSSVKKIKGFQTVSVICSDNVVVGENISNYFVNKYSEL